MLLLHQASARSLLSSSGPAPARVGSPRSTPPRSAPGPGAPLAPRGPLLRPSPTLAGNPVRPWDHHATSLESPLSLRRYLALLPRPPTLGGQKSGPGHPLRVGYILTDLFGTAGLDVPMAPLRPGKAGGCASGVARPAGCHPPSCGCGSGSRTGSGTDPEARGSWPRRAGSCGPSETSLNASDSSGPCAPQVRPPRSKGAQGSTSGNG